MTTARKYQINLENTPYYHCISRCIKRSFLCGDDKYSGKNFDHRKQWILDRLALLATTFAIDVCAYGIMSNHYHLVLKIDASTAKRWSTEEVIQRWTQLFKGDVVTQLYIKGFPLTEAEIQSLHQKAEIWRGQLMSISWFMRCLNQPIAQMANQEEGCKGRFWEGRFTSQALLDEQALIAAMVYVDLNPIRAGICNNLESSEFTSIAQRLREYAHPEHYLVDSLKTSSSEVDFQVNARLSRAEIEKPINRGNLKPHLSPNPLSQNRVKVPLASFIGGAEHRNGIPYTLEDYFELIDWTGRAIRADKKGRIKESEPKIIHKLGLDSDTWLDTVGNFRDYFYTFIGPKNILTKICQQLGKKWVMGGNPCRRLFNHLNSICF